MMNHYLYIEEGGFLCQIVNLLFVETEVKKIVLRGWLQQNIGVLVLLASIHTIGT